MDRTLQLLTIMVVWLAALGGTAVTLIWAPAMAEGRPPVVIVALLMALFFATIATTSLAPGPRRHDTNRQQLL